MVYIVGLIVVTGFTGKFIDGSIALGVAIVGGFAIGICVQMGIIAL